GPAGQEWIEAAEFADRPPEGVGVQSFTFVNPAADLLAWVMQGGDQAYLTFGIALLFGMIVGSAVYAVFNRGFRIEWFSSWGDFMRHIVGGALMGLGGVLALGCTVGQGVSGFSSMALGSPIAMVAIMLSSALTIKTEYYKILYEDASTGAAFVSALADMRLVPQSMRKLEAL
ncbi:MAG: YeeE/YedE thiosulfate transporter family protein, partial [Gammaproteobacteria bacterium]